MTDDERMKLVSTDTSLGMDTEPRIPTAISGLETFTLGRSDSEEEETPARKYDAESLFNLPASTDDDEDDEDDRGRRR
jgi:hypothetical protein